MTQHFQLQNCENHGATMMGVKIRCFLASTFHLKQIQGKTAAICLVDAGVLLTAPVCAVQELRGAAGPGMGVGVTEAEV